nr:hypothetical protein [uncultured Arsenicibacter sp.]
MIHSYTKSSVALMLGLFVFTASCSKKREDVAPAETSCTPAEFTHSLDGKPKGSVKLTTTAGLITGITYTDAVTNWKAAIRNENGLPVAMDGLDDTGKVDDKDAVTFQYDSQKRLTTFAVYYTYDGVRQAIRKISLSYTTSGQVAKITDQSFGSSDELTPAFDANGDLTKITIPDGKTTAVFLESAYETTQPNPVGGLPVGLRLLINYFGSYAYYNTETNYDLLLSKHRLKSRTYPMFDATESFTYPNGNAAFSTVIKESGKQIAANTFTVNTVCK